MAIFAIILGSLATFTSAGCKIFANEISRELLVRLKIEERETMVKGS